MFACFFKNEITIGIGFGLIQNTVILIQNKQKNVGKRKYYEPLL
jgi:hypothetical protein